LVLSPNWSYVSKESGTPRSEFAGGSLAALTTDRDVSIGDTPPAIRAKLGFPTRVRGSGAGNKTYTYVWRRGREGNRREYKAVYTFRADRLQSIAFSDDLLDGG
jgi:hypothetical protein